MTTYRTEDLTEAAYLHSTRKLRFLRCESNGGRIAFLFDDPKNEGEQLRIDFLNGAECPATTFYDSIRHLRRIMDATSGVRR